jgi:ketosteroid isomerase-like protein
MKTKKNLLFLAVMLVIVSCTPKTTTTVNKDKALADSLLQINENAYNSGNAQKIADMFTDDCLAIDGIKPTWSKDSLLVIAKSEAPYIKNFRAHLGVFSVTNDMVYMEKYWTGDWVAGSNTLKAKGISILVWLKQPDSTWKIALEKTDGGIKPY